MNHNQNQWDVTVKPHIKVCSTHKILLTLHKLNEKTLQH